MWILIPRVHCPNFTLHLYASPCFHKCTHARPHIQSATSVIFQGHRVHCFNTLVLTSRTHTLLLQLTVSTLSTRKNPSGIRATIRGKHLPSTCVPHSHYVSLCNAKPQIPNLSCRYFVRFCHKIENLRFFLT